MLKKFERNLENLSVSVTRKLQHVISGNMFVEEDGEKAFQKMMPVCVSTLIEISGLSVFFRQLYVRVCEIGGNIQEGYFHRNHYSKESPVSNDFNGNTHHERSPNFANSNR